VQTQNFFSHLRTSLARIRGSYYYYYTITIIPVIRRSAMPTYEYQCAKCGEEFTCIMSLKEYEAGQVSCPKCKSADVKQQMSDFMPKTSRKS
jgi:putative FmdB family regulatory protein